MLQLTIAGRLGRDAELRSTQTGKQVCGFSVAVDVRKGGEKVTQWVECSLWEKRGEALVQYLKKGTPVAVTGDLSVRQYDGKNGPGIAVECNVRDVALLGSATAGDRAPAPAQASKPKPTSDAVPYDDDIPF